MPRHPLLVPRAARAAVAFLDPASAMRRALECQGCRLPKATRFGANAPLPAAAKSTTRSGAAPGGGSGKAPPRAGPRLSAQLAQAQRELAGLKELLEAGGPASAGGRLGGAQSVEVDDGEGAGAGDAAALAEIHMRESGLRAIKDQAADWAAAPRAERRARLEKAKARRFAGKPPHARTHAIANKVHAYLLEQQVAQLQQQAPQAQPPRPAGQATAQDVIGGLGITVGELEAVVMQQLSAHPNEEQPVPAEAQKRMAGAMGERIAELCMSKRARREGPPSEEQASASQDLANTAGVVHAGAERGGQSQLAPEAAAPGSGSGSAVVPRWQPEEESVEQLQQRLRKHGPGLEAGASSLARISLFLSTWLGAIAKGSIFTANVTAGGSLARCAEGVCERAEAVVLLVQEHRARDHDRLAALQQAVLGHGHAGLWAPAVQGPRGEAGTSGEAAVLARSHTTVTSPPFLESPVLLAARLVAAHVHWGVAGGFVGIAACFHSNLGWNAHSQHVAAVLMKHLAKLNAAGIDWIAGGGFTMGPARFPAQQLHGVRGLWAAAGDATCRPRAGAWSTLDYFPCATSLAPRLGRPQADEYGTPQPRLSVAMEMHTQDLPLQVRVVRGPRPIGPAPPVGCSRGVDDWRKPLATVRAAVSREHLPEAWGAMVATAEQELLDRCDVAGHDRTKYVGRRARHLMGVGAYVAKAARQLHGAGLLCPLFDAQFDKLAVFLLERMLMFAQADFAGQASRVVEYANGQYEAALAAQQKEWVNWASEFFSHGAGRAHRCSKVRDLQEVITAWHGQQQDASPHLARDREMQPWAKVWRCHGLQQARRPADIEEWEALPELTVDKMKRAVLSFPAGTAMGPAKIGMRALSFLSVEGMYVCAQLFMRMEKLGTWPEGRLGHAVRRLPKPSGGCRRIALMHSMVRMWSRARADISMGWLTQHPGVDIWGLGAGRSSSDAAFDLNLETEVAVALEEQVFTVLLDARKFFETVTPEALIQEARLLKMPLPLVWLVVELYRQPRRLQAFGSVSYEVVALVDDVILQWIRTAGSNVSVLWAAVTRFREEAKQLGIIVYPAKSGYVTSSKGLAAECRKHAGSRGLQLLHWARNLGHDLGGGRIQRRRTKLRLKAPARRRGRLAALKRAAGRKVTVLWRTGLLPSAGHGAGVAGISDDELQRLRAEASRLAGARPGPPGATIYLATQRSARFDPICDEATVALVVRYSSWAWEQRTSLGRLQRAWASITQRLVEKPTWGLAGSPIASTMLTLWREEEQHIYLLATSPSDLKAFHVEGVSRWQGRQILSHFGGGQPTVPIWMRVLRLCAGGKGAAVAEGPAATGLGIHWAGAPWTRQGQLDVGVAPDGSCLACGGEEDTPGHRLRGCEALLRARQSGPPGGSELGTARFVATRSSVEQDVFPDRLQQTWTTMRDKGLQAGGAGVADFSGFAHEAGLPVTPPRMLPAADEAEVRLGGGWSGRSDEQRGDIAFTDGSGFASSMPELRRCGRSLGSNGVPVRAAFGALPGRLQTVGRAERHALLQVTELLGQQARFVATDLLALAQEASSWGPELERVKAVHAPVWRLLRQQPCHPLVFWAPAHQDVDGYLAAGLHPVLRAGNLWADWFAKQGALQHAVPQVYTEFYAIEVQYFKQVADCIGWAMQRCLATGDSPPEARYVPAAPPPPVPKLTAVERSLARVQVKRGMLCTERGRRPRAEAGAAVQQYVKSSCLPAPLARLKAAAEVVHFGAGPHCMGGAEGLGAEALQPCDGGRPCKLAPRPNPFLHEGDGRGVVLRLGHRLRRAAPAIFCEVCVAWMQTRAARGLQKACCGPPTDKGHHQRTYVSNLVARRDRLLRGLGPKTGRSWATGTLVHDERSSVDDSSEESTGEAVAALGSAVAPLADAQGAATRGRTEASRLLAEVVARRSVCAAPAPSWQERLERVATREAGPACVAAGGAGRVPKAQVVEALADTGCAVGDRAGSWAVRGLALLRRLHARAERLCGGAGAAPRAAPAGFAARLRRNGIRVARPPPRAVLPQRPPRPLALERRWRRFLRAMGSTARQLAEARCRRAWSRGARLRGAYARYRSGLTLRSQRCVTDGMRRYEVHCLRSWLAAPAGLPPAQGWARAARRWPRPGAAAALREGQGRLGAQAASQDHRGGEGSDAGEGRLGCGLHGSGAVHLAQVGWCRGSSGDAVVVSFGLAIDLII
ncbi:unnamed protein product [Prorocentrum cordatum]|uniref:Reverse transcriptase domain-containing protein n=1 Tax=Prorocentrum cordatum TaxID=2364126 RepID=A0ABN9QUU8_9DINO|nr:unnamed protein product [Polarella glacialis]